MTIVAVTRPVSLMMGPMNVKHGWYWMWLGLVVIGVMAGCSQGRDVTDSERVFKAVIVDPIPSDVRDIASTGLLAGDEGSGHVLYLRFQANDAFVQELIAMRDLVPFDCDSDFVQGNLTLSQGLELDIVEWRPFNVDPDAQCYTTRRSYTNAWTKGARGIMLYQPRTGIVYYNEIGLIGQEMAMRRWVGFLLVGLMLMVVVVVSAQNDDGEANTLTIGESFQVTLDGEGDGRLYTFMGEAGDVVYVTGVDDDGSDADILFEIYAPDGRLTGVVSDPPFDPFTIAELPETGTYTLILSHDSFSEETYTIILGRSGYLGTEPLSVEFSVNGPPVLFLARVEDSGPFVFSFRGDLSQTQPLDVSVRDFTASDSGREIVDFRAQDGRFLMVTTGLDTGSIYTVSVRGGRVSSGSDLLGMNMIYDVRLNRAE